MSVDWSYYNKFSEIEDMYLPDYGEGDTMATQIVTATTKLVYKWYNDGDVFDNTYALSGWWNDLSSYANWLVKNTDRAEVLYDIEKIETEDEYEELLKKLVDSTHNEEYLEEMSRVKKTGSIYSCDGPFFFKESSEEEDDDSYDGYYEEDDGLDDEFYD